MSSLKAMMQRNPHGFHMEPFTGPIPKRRFHLMRRDWYTRKYSYFTTAMFDDKIRIVEQETKPEHPWEIIEETNSNNDGGSLFHLTCNGHVEFTNTENFQVNYGNMMTFSSNHNVFLVAQKLSEPRSPEYFMFTNAMMHHIIEREDEFKEINVEFFYDEERIHEEKRKQQNTMEQEFENMDISS